MVQNVMIRKGNQIYHVMRIELKSNEFVLKAADTKHYINENKVAGKLVLTNQRLYFASSNGTESNLRMEIEPRCIHEVYNFRNRSLFANGLCLQLKDGKELRFELKNRNDWAGMIARVI